MDKLRKLAVLIFEGAPVGVRVVGDSGFYDISFSFLASHQVHLFNHYDLRRISLKENSDGLLVTKAELKGLQVKDGELHFDTVLALLKQHDGVTLGRTHAVSLDTNVSSLASTSTRIGSTSVFLS